MKKAIMALAVMASATALGYDTKFPGYFLEDFQAPDNGTYNGCYWAPYGVYEDAADRTNYVNFQHDGVLYKARFVDGTAFDAMEVLAQTNPGAVSGMLDGAGLMLWANALRGVSLHEAMGFETWTQRGDPAERVIGCKDELCTLRVLLGRSGSQNMTLDINIHQLQFNANVSMNHNTRCTPETWVVFEDVH